MRVLVANLGSTSFKYKLLDMDSGAEIARGGFERIGQPDSQHKNHSEVVALINQAFATPPDAIGFKAVHGGPISGAVRVTDEVIAKMEEFADVAPAHNPRYIAAMREFQRTLPDVPQVAVFETSFHQTIPASRRTYAIPWDWTERLGIRRYGFHGASHRYVAERTLQLLGKDRTRRVISCHLGGSSSVCAIENGKSVANSFGMTPQSGLPQNNRVGDFDVMALTRLFRSGMRLDEILVRLSTESGLLGISGVSSDFRDVETAANAGNVRARLAIDVLVEAVRHYIGAYLVVLGGCDALVFTGGIGENAVALREAVCRGLEFAGIELDDGKNHVRGREEEISAVESDVDIWVIPTNEELIVAEQTVAVLSAN
ncbi:acetate/propionate family kinase [soil metagenome]